MDKKVATCDYCGKGFASNWALKRHIRTTCKAKTLLFSCLACFASFTTPHLLERHERSCSKVALNTQLLPNTVDNSSYFYLSQQHQQQQHQQSSQQMQQQQSASSINQRGCGIQSSGSGTQHNVNGSDATDDDEALHTMNKHSDLGTGCSPRKRFKGNDDRFLCYKCGSSSKYASNIRRHERKCQGSHSCKRCGGMFSSVKKRNRHQKKCAQFDIGPCNFPVERYGCKTCTKRFGTRRELYRHTHLVHPIQFGTGAQLQNRPFKDEEAPWIMENGETDRKLQHAYEADERLILAPSENESNPRVYNFPITNDITADDIVKKVEEIYNSERHSFKVNLSLGYLLYDRETKEYRYFRPYRNSFLLDKPFTVSSRKDLARLRELINKLDAIAKVMNARDNTKYVIKTLTNLQARVYPTRFTIGNVALRLPKYLADSRNIICLDKDKHQKSYQDNLCLFRCLAVHQHGVEFTEENVLQLFEEWKSFLKKPSLHRNLYRGVELRQIPKFETCFKTNISIYSLNDNQEAQLVYNSLGRQESSMCLNLYENHLSYITNFENYCKKFRCRHCGFLSNTRLVLQRHESICGNKSRFRFPGGYHKPAKTIFEELEHIGIHVDEAERYYPYVMVFDFESMLLKKQQSNSSSAKRMVLETTQNRNCEPQASCFEETRPNQPTNKSSSKIVYTQEHAPVSFAIATNVDGFTDTIFEAHPDPNELVRRMHGHMTQIAEKAEGLLLTKWHAVFERLTYLKNLWKPVCEQDPSHTDCFLDINEDNDSVTYEETGLHIDENRRAIYNEDDDDDCNSDYDDHDDVDDDNNSDSESTNDDAKASNRLEINVKENVQGNIARQSSKAKTDHFAGAEAVKTTQSHEFMASVSGAAARKIMYKSLCRLEKSFSEYVRQVPVLGFNSSRYDLHLIFKQLVTYFKLADEEPFIVKRNNRYMCISLERFRFADILNYLPPNTSYAKFLSAFKIDTTKSFFPYEWLDSFEKLQSTELPELHHWTSSISGKSVLDDGRPDSIEINYAYVQAIFNQLQPRTMLSYLQDYNSRDVQPGLTAILKMMAFYRERGVCIFKSCISVPGCARKMLYQTARDAGVGFSLFDAANQDLYFTLKKNLVGGPSIIHKRHAKAKETTTSGNKTCEKVVGYDCNSLYLWCIGQHMPVGAFVRRLRANDFKPEIRDRYNSMFYWMDYLNSKGHRIQHQRNIGEYIIRLRTIACHALG